MLTTRQVFAYRLRGRDIFDDLDELDRQEAKQELGEKNNFGLLLSEMLMTLGDIGVDVENNALSDLLAPTEVVDIAEIESDKEEDDYILAPPDLIIRRRKRIPNNSVKKTMIEFMMAKKFNDELLLDAPYDIAVNMFNDYIKEQNKRNKRR